MLATIIISLALAGIVAAIIYSFVRAKKRGKSTCCSGCSHCGMAGCCHGNEK